MKKLFLFLAMASTTMFVSCGSDDSSEPAATSITLTASATTIDLGATVTLTVTDNLGENVTSTSTFFNGTTAIAASFTPTAAGTYSLTAKNGDLTSAAVTVTVNAVAEANAIFIDGENFDVNNSATVLWGGYAEVEGGETTHSLWSMVVINSAADFVDALIDPTSVSEYIDIEFIVPLDAEGNLQLPTIANMTYLDIYEVHVDNTDVTLTSQEGGSLTFATELPEAVDSPFAFVATADYNNGSSLEVNYDGNWAGMFDATSGRGIIKGDRNTVALPKKVLSKGEKTRAKAKFFANIK